MNALGIDIGGANLKYACTNGKTHSVDFPLWKHPQRLASQLTSDIKRFADCARVVATMTGELADCFLDRREGVHSIIDQLCNATQQCGLPEPQLYAVDGRFYSASAAKDTVDRVAAANWHALASFVARDFAPSGLLIDIGSTTCDIIPLANGTVATSASTDFQRLASGSLVYLGGQRTPVCSVVNQLSWQGARVPVMREVFATMDDVRLLLNYEDANPLDHDSADGKPRDHFHAANRLARMIGLDHREVTVEDARSLATEIHQTARDLIQSAIDRFPTGKTLVVSGHCSDLAPSDLAPSDSAPSDSAPSDSAPGDSAPCGLAPNPKRVESVKLSSQLGYDLSRCAPAYAIAKLANDASIDIRPH